MLKCRTKKGGHVWVSRTYDCEPNVGGFYCTVYADKYGDIEIDNFTVSADEVEKDFGEPYIRSWVWDNSDDIHALLTAIN